MSGAEDRAKDLWPPRNNPGRLGTLGRYKNDWSKRMKKLITVGVDLKEVSVKGAGE